MGMEWRGRRENAMERKEDRQKGRQQPYPPSHSLISPSALPPRQSGATFPKRKVAPIFSTGSAGPRYGTTFLQERSARSISAHLAANECFRPAQPPSGNSLSRPHRTGAHKAESAARAGPHGAKLYLDTMAPSSRGAAQHRTIPQQEGGDKRGKARGKHGKGRPATAICPSLGANGTCAAGTTGVFLGLGAALLSCLGRYHSDRHPPSPLYLDPHPNPSYPAIAIDSNQCD